MARNNKHAFFKGMLIYALVFLIILAASLAVLWDYMAAFEGSRPKNTVDAYVAALTPGDMCGKFTEAFGEPDQNLQSLKERDTVITASLTDRVTYARKSAESTEEHQVYVLRCGSQVIGQVVISAQTPDRYGFTKWTVTEESFDFSYLKGQPLVVTVPQDFTVCVNGYVLDERYITESGIQYSALEEFYGDYSLPTMVTYTADGYWGQIELSVSDENGQPVIISEETDRDTFLENCSSQEQEQLEAFMGDFIESYVAFTGASNQSSKANYQWLRKNFLVPDSALAQRLYTALDGLAYAQSYGDRVAEIIVHRVSRLDDTHYFCDATYCVDTYGKAGIVQTRNNMKVILLVTVDGLRVEAMTRY